MSNNKYPYIWRNWCQLHRKLTVENISIMAIFGASKLFLYIFGIVPISEKWWPNLSRKYKIAMSLFLIIFTSVSLCSYLASLGYFFIIKARSPIIFFLSAFFFTVTLMRVTLFFLILCERSKLSSLMDDLETTIEKRK